MHGEYSEIMKKFGEQQDLLSVIIPAYNVESYIEECVQSVIKQTYNKLQIIIIDDGSTDDTGAICDQLEQKDNRVIVRHVNHAGTICARKLGVNLAKGNYITFVDGDDFIDANMYESLMNYIYTYKCQVVISGKISYFSHNYKKSHYDIFREGYYNRGKIKQEIIPKMIWNDEKQIFPVDPSLCNKIFEKSIIYPEYEKIGNEQFHYGEDMAILYPLIAETESMYISHKCFYFHRQRGKGEIPSYVKDPLIFDKLLSLKNYLQNNIKVENSKIQEDLNCQIDLFYFHALEEKKRTYYNLNRSCDRWFFPFDKVEKNQKVVIYGAGEMGQLFYSQLNRIKYCSEVKLVDINCFKFNPEILSVLHPDMLKELVFDCIVIAINDIKLRKKISISLQHDYGIKEETLVWDY